MTQDKPVKHKKEVDCFRPRRRSGGVFDDREFNVDERTNNGSLWFKVD